MTVLTPLAGVAGTSEAIKHAVATFNWQTVDLVHAELGGGRLGEFLALRELRKAYSHLPLTATVHDPERIVWRRERLPFPLNLLERLPSPLPQAAVVLADPLTLREERQVAKGLTRLVTLTRLGADCLRLRMQLPPGKVAVINHANLAVPPAPCPRSTPCACCISGSSTAAKASKTWCRRWPMSSHRPLNCAATCA